MSEAVTLAAVKAYLRIDANDEDELLHRLIATATEACEQYIGKVVLARTIEDVMFVSPWWQRLEEMPVIAITAVEEVTGGGGRRALDVADYAIDLPAGGAGLVRVAVRGIRRIAVTYRAGLADTREAVPAGLAQGIIRHVSHLFCCRDEAADGGLPMAVTLHWQRYKTMRLGGPRP